MHELFHCDLIAFLLPPYITKPEHAARPWHTALLSDHARDPGMEPKGKDGSGVRQKSHDYRNCPHFQKEMGGSPYKCKISVCSGQPLQAFLLRFVFGSQMSELDPSFCNHLLAKLIGIRILVNDFLNTGVD